MTDRIDFRIQVFYGDGITKNGRLTSDRSLTPDETARSFGIAVIQTLYSVIREMGLDAEQVHQLVLPIRELLPFYGQGERHED